MAAEISMEPRQPNRLEKKKNIQPHYPVRSGGNGGIADLASISRALRSEI